MVRKALVVLALLLMSTLAWGQDDVQRAKDLFRQGVELFKANDLERALELFLQSRAAHESIANTSNAAICLDRLGRYDEALEMYEAVLTKFKNELSDEERASMGPAMETLRQKVGNVWISANVEGSVVIDGRERGRLPLTIPIRVLPGKRNVRVIAPGYVTWQREVEIAAAEEERLDAVLEPLADAGMLRIRADDDGARVFVDGTAMGTTPWEGTLGPGPHLVWIEKGDVGSAPREVIVVQGQTAIVEIKTEPLGGELAVRVTPAGARLSIDGVDVGSGYRGRLPSGSHRLRASEDGYHPAERTITVGPTSQSVSLELEVDPEHPRWPKPDSGHAFLQAAGGYAIGATLGSEAEDNCIDCPGAPIVHGFEVAVHGGYRFGIGLSLELALGYMRLTSSFDRTAMLGDAPLGYDNMQFELRDTLLVHGPFAAFGLGYRYGFAERWAISGRALGGALLSAASDDVTGEVVANNERAPVTVSDADPVARTGTIFVHADVSIAVDVAEDLELGLSLALHAFFSRGRPSTVAA